MFHREEISKVLECLPTSAFFFSVCWEGKEEWGTFHSPKGTLLGCSTEPKDGSWDFRLPSLGSWAPVCIQIFQ